MAKAVLQGIKPWPATDPLVDTKLPESYRDSVRRRLQRKFKRYRDELLKRARAAIADTDSEESIELQIARELAGKSVHEKARALSQLLISAKENDRVWIEVQHALFRKGHKLSAEDKKFLLKTILHLAIMEHGFPAFEQKKEVNEHKPPDDEDV